MIGEPCVDSTTPQCQIFFKLASIRVGKSNLAVALGCVVYDGVRNVSLLCFIVCCSHL